MVRIPAGLILSFWRKRRRSASEEVLIEGAFRFTSVAAATNQQQHYLDYLPTTTSSKGGIEGNNNRDVLLLRPVRHADSFRRRTGGRVAEFVWTRGHNTDVCARGSAPRLQVLHTDGAWPDFYFFAVRRPHSARREGAMSRRICAVAATVMCVAAAASASGESHVSRAIANADEKLKARRPWVHDRLLNNLTLHDGACEQRSSVQLRFDCSGSNALLTSSHPLPHDTPHAKGWPSRS